MAAIAPWFRLRLPSWALGSNPKHTIYTFFNLNWNYNEKRRKISKTRLGLAHFKKTYKNGPFQASFSLFSSFQYTVDNNQTNKVLPMTGFEPWTFGIRSDRSTNWATQPLIQHLESFLKGMWQTSHPTVTAKKFLCYWSLSADPVQLWT